MTAVKNYACPSCKAPLAFEPGSGQWKCDYCFNSYTLEQLETQIETSHPEEALEEDAPELDSYHCENCGAELIADATTAATFCLYCKSPAIIKNRFSGRFKPTQVIPFKLTKKQAETIYRDWIKKCLFAPSAFQSKTTIEEVTGIYAPFWMYDTTMTGTLDGEGQTISHWTTGDYNYTLIKYFRAYRKGTVSYDNVPVDASIKLDDTLMHKIEPFNYADMVPFSMQYLSGFMAERYDLEEENARPFALSRINDYAAKKFKQTISQYQHFTPRLEEYAPQSISDEYVLMPIYLLNNKFKGQDHLFIVNGQTGKVVGQTPISKAKQALFAAALFLGFSLLGVIGGAFFV